MITTLIMHIDTTIHEIQKMKISSEKKQNDPIPAKKRDHDAWSGWGAVIGTASGIVIGLFFHRTIALGAGLGITGWLAGGLIDRSRQ